MCECRISTFLSRKIRASPIVPPRWLGLSHKGISSTSEGMSDFTWAATIGLHTQNSRKWRRLMPRSNIRTCSSAPPRAVVFEKCRRLSTSRLMASGAITPQPSPTINQLRFPPFAGSVSPSPCSCECRYEHRTECAWVRQDRGLRGRSHPIRDHRDDNHAFPKDSSRRR